MTGPQRRQVLKSKLRLTTHSEEKLAGAKLWEVILWEDTLSGEAGNVKKEVGAQRVREASKIIHRPKKRAGH